MQKSFLFDINKCTGCQACTIACSTENYEQQEINWRDVHIYNEAHIPELPYFNLSLACNHCVEPACLSACPAKAYSKDAETGAVLINQDHCIGCKYCTWACPYDAPKFNQKKNVIEKCTFCNDRLKSGNHPACTVACPTGSLRITEWQPDEIAQSIEGFTNTDLNPAVKFIPLREGYKVPDMIEASQMENSPDLFKLNHSKPERKISLKSEWPLVIFTSIMFFLVSWFTAHIVRDVIIIPNLFIGLGAISLLFSSLHLGKKFRAYRAILNFKSSWLSREIVFVTVFLFFASAHLISNQITEHARWIAIISGFAGLYSIDMLYRVTISRIPLQYHSASTFLTGLYLFGIFTQSFLIVITFGIVKLLFYLYRKYSAYKYGHKIFPLISTIRLSTGIILPVVILFTDVNFNLGFVSAIISVMIAEIIDRCEFYNELDIISPKIQIEKDMRKDLNNNRVN